MAARVCVAPGDVALDDVRVVLRDAVLGADIEHAKWFAALAFRALVVLARHLLGVVDQCVSVGALDRVAEALMF